MLAFVGCLKASSIRWIEFVTLVFGKNVIRWPRHSPSFRTVYSFYFSYMTCPVILKSCIGVKPSSIETWNGKEVGRNMTKTCLDEVLGKIGFKGFLTPGTSTAVKNREGSGNQRSTGQAAIWEQHV